MKIDLNRLLILNKSSNLFKNYKISYFTPFIKNIYKIFIKGVRLQLFITLISLPLLLYWGLPISLTGILGNFIFTPFLALFLIISFLIFLTELVFLPNTIFVWILEQITSLWCFLGTFTSCTHLLYISTPSILVIIFLLLITLIIIYKTKSASWLIIVLLVTLGYLYYHDTALEKIIILSRGSHKIALIKYNNTMTAIDTGVFTSNYQSFINYSLKPTFTKNFGKRTIDNLIILKPSFYTFTALEFLYSIFVINNIFIPDNHKKPSKGCSAAYENLKKIAHKHHTHIHILNKKKEIICTNNYGSIILTKKPSCQTFNKYNAHATQKFDKFYMTD